MEISCNSIDTEARTMLYIVDAAQREVVTVANKDLIDMSINIWDIDTLGTYKVTFPYTTCINWCNWKYDVGIYRRVDYAASGIDDRKLFIFPYWEDGRCVTRIIDSSLIFNTLVEAANALLHVKVVRTMSTWVDKDVARLLQYETGPANVNMSATVSKTTFWV